MKVMVIGKIAEFVRWPTETGLDDPDRPFDVTILGDTALEAPFERYYAHARIAGHPVTVRRARSLAEVDWPHLLLLGPSVEPELGALLTRLGRAPILP